MNNAFKNLCLVIAMLLSTPSFAETQTFTSSNQQTALIELYTSEGCSSCPPADKWLSTLKQRPGLWNEFIPLAFHVDYWDYIGWKDRFASAQFSDRQRNYSRQQSLHTVYTPGFLLNGKEWRKWYKGGHIAVGDGSLEPGILTVEKNRTSAKVKFVTDKFNNKALVINLALVGLGLSSDVNRGENSGRTLHHDFVVLDHTSNLLNRDKKGEYTGQFQVPNSSHSAEKYALVAWVNSPSDQTPIQATGGLLDK